MRILQQGTDDLDECSYLADRAASMEYKVLLDVTPGELDELLVRGWRRFGPSYFRPACRSCGECASIRVPVELFRPSRSQRRARDACAGLRVVVSPPRVDDERLALYQAWHAVREQTRAWTPARLDEETYALEFAFPHPAARELAYYEDRPGAPPRLVGVALCDETPRCWSAVYFYFHPEWQGRSLGTANVVRQIELARTRGIPHVYLGYRVLGCPSLRYKASFRPHELLAGRPSATDSPVWA